MLELTISNGNGNLTLGVMNNIIKYRKNGERPINSNPFDEERILFYSKYSDGRTAVDFKEDISMNPKIDYYPVIIGHNHESEGIPGKIIEINEKT